MQRSMMSKIFLTCIITIVLNYSTSTNILRNAHSQFPEILASRYEYTDEDVSDAAPMPSTNQYEESESNTKGDTSGSIQFMITNRMRRLLENDLNYLSEEVDMMDPQIASVVIERGLARPTTGMPKAWQREQPSSPIFSNLIVNMKKQMNNLSSGIKKGVNIIVRRILPVAIPTVVAIYALPKLFTLFGKARVSLSQKIADTSKKIEQNNEMKKISSPIKEPKTIPIINKVNVEPKKKENRLDMEYDNLNVEKISNKIDMRALNKIVRPPSLFEKIGLFIGWA